VGRRWAAAPDNAKQSGQYHTVRVIQDCAWCHTAATMQPWCKHAYTYHCKGLTEPHSILHLLVPVNWHLSGEFHRYEDSKAELYSRNVPPSAERNQLSHQTHLSWQTPIPPTISPQLSFRSHFWSNSIQRTPTIGTKKSLNIRPGIPLRNINFRLTFNQPQLIQLKHHIRRERWARRLLLV